MTECEMLKTKINENIIIFVHKQRCTGYRCESAMQFINLRITWNYVDKKILNIILLVCSSSPLPLDQRRMPS